MLDEGYKKLMQTLLADPVGSYNKMSKKDPDFKQTIQKLADLLSRSRTLLMVLYGGNTLAFDKAYLEEKELSLGTLLIQSWLNDKPDFDVAGERQKLYDAYYKREKEEWN